jgi:hypothetical protein
MGLALFSGTPASRGKEIIDMADDKPQQHENKDAESGEPIQLDKDQPQQPQQPPRKPQQQDEGNEAGGMKQGADRPQPEGGQKR